MNTALNVWRETVKSNKNQTIIHAIQNITPGLSSEECVRIHEICLRLEQGSKSKNGKEFESVIENQLRVNNIPYMSQVAIDSDGKIIGTGTVVDDHAHTLDIVVGRDIKNGCSISDFIVLSCKTTVRERWRQDEWSLKHEPKMYVLCTIGDDYPNSKKFQESSTRKIVTQNPKKRDDRMFKMGFDDLLQELSGV
tara:strand:+ start:72 stop:653 length:582 start_codon:yes stop_codon:yes gene_type:complete